MINIDNVKKEFLEFVNKYDNQSDPGYELKIAHTMHVVENAKIIASLKNLSEEDTELAQLIAYLHDIGRFEELKVLKEFDSLKFEHALYGSKMLFEDNLIRRFISDDSYDNIIKKAIENHSKLYIESGLTDRELLHAKIIRDADKLDNFRVKKDELIENVWAGKYSNIEDFNNSLISDKVYNNILKHECVDIHDRIYPLDYWICILAFVFDINFKETFKIIKENDYINVLVSKFNYTSNEIKDKMENIKNIINEFVNNKINDKKEDKVIYETENFYVLARWKPHVSREEGGHIRIKPKRKVKNRYELTPKEAKELIRLTMLAGEAMINGMKNRGVDIEIINFQDNGNWAYLRFEVPAFHIHLYGRTKDSVKQKFGEALYFPNPKDEYYKDLTPLDDDDIEEIRKQIHLLENTEKYDLSNW